MDRFAREQRRSPYRCLCIVGKRDKEWMRETREKMKDRKRESEERNKRCKREKDRSEWISLDLKPKELQ